MVRYHHVKSEKTNNPILRKLSDGRDRQTDGQTYRQTDGRTDGHMDESDFKGRSPINVKRPKHAYVNLVQLYE